MQYSSCCNHTLHTPNSVTILQRHQFPGSLNTLCASSADCGLALHNTQHFTVCFLNLCSAATADRQSYFCNKFYNGLIKNMLVSRLNLLQL